MILDTERHKYQCFKQLVGETDPTPTLSCTQNSMGNLYDKIHTLTAFGHVDQPHNFNGFKLNLLRPPAWEYPVGEIFVYNNNNNNTVIIIALKGTVRDLYNPLIAPQTVSNAYAEVARAQLSSNHMPHVQHVKCHVVQRDSSAVKFSRA